MKKTRLLRDADDKKLGVILSVAEFKRLSEDSEEINCIRAYDMAKASGERPIPYAQVWKKIDLVRKRAT
jgi:hypothetical protein